MIRRLVALLVSVLALLVLLTVGANAWVVLQAGEPQHDLTQLQAAPVALVLGTSHWSSAGRPNRHFAGRMDAAAELYHAGLVKHVLASGANPEIYYNEPQRMLEALLERGVPKQAITLDYAGRRTLDSVLRAEQVFGQRNIIIVSQGYHLYRALYLAKAHGLQAQGYAADGPVLRQRWRTELREVLARLLAVVDTQILRTEAEVLGTPEPISL
ncbi:MAG: SanA/YdcF family protein [Oceanococcus sp.]